jgi:hypothetical protein
MPVLIVSKPRSDLLFSHVFSREKLQPLSAGHAIAEAHFHDFF